MDLSNDALSVYILCFIVVYSDIIIYACMEERKGRESTNSSYVPILSQLGVVFIFVICDICSKIVKLAGV